MILLIDNYDSFTFNIYQALSKFKYPIHIARSDKITINEIKQMDISHIVIGPGPKSPKDAGISIQIVKTFSGIYPILGICLGHQAILSAFGVEIVNAKNIVHGKVEPLQHNGKGIFRNITQDTPVTRYHSLAAKASDIPSCFSISAFSKDGEVMAVEHNSYHLVGLQFHPESIGSADGTKMLLNFLHYQRDTIPIKSYLKKALSGEKLSFRESYEIMDELTEGNMQDAQIGSLFSSLEIHGVNAEELAGFASVLKKKAVDFNVQGLIGTNGRQLDKKCLDIVGTGGSNIKTFNVSTTSAFLLNTAGVNVIKHGNRAITSKSGSADLLEKLGINVNMSVQRAKEIYKELGITFVYALTFHSALRFASSARKALGFKTAFNLIGPLANPANVTHQLIGVFDKAYTEIMAEAMEILGVKKAMIVSGFDGYDEISLTAPTKITELSESGIKSYVFTPMEVGLEYVDYSLLKGGNSDINAQITLDIFNAMPSAKLDLVCLNAGAAMYLYGECESIKDGFYKMKKVIESKKVLEVLNKFKELSFMD